MLRWFVFLCVFNSSVLCVGAALDKMPDVLIVCSHLEREEATRGVERESGWMVPGVEPNMAALLYGKTPLECGVVSGFDWRRKPVMAESLAELYRAHGYRTVYIGKWNMGAAKPYDPASRGFDAWILPAGSKTLTASGLKVKEREWEKRFQQLFGDRPCFCMVRETRGELFSKSVSQYLQARGKRELFVVRVDRKSFQISGDWCGIGKVKLAWAGVKSVSGLSRRLAELAGGKKVLDEDGKYQYYHRGGWPANESAEKYRFRDAWIKNKKFALVNGLNLYRVDAQGEIEWKHPLDIAVFSKEHQTLLLAYGRWWRKASVAVRSSRPFDVGGKGQKEVKLTAYDWRPSRVPTTSKMDVLFDPMVKMDRLLSILNAIRHDESYKERFPSYSGSWSLKILKAGRYKITARLLPDTARYRSSELAKLQGGEVFFRLGKNEVNLKVKKGASEVSVFTDADAGVVDLECYFTGQLSLDRILGAFFVSIERVGDKKFDFDLQSQERKKGE